jgi:hypothetical protein
MNDELRSGDIMFGPIGGAVPGLLPVGAGQLLLFVSRRWWRMTRSIRTWFHIRHVGIVDTYSGADIDIIQAMPAGVEAARLDPAKHWTSGHVYVRPDYPYPGQGGDVADAALSYLKRRYGFLTYAKLAAGALRMRFTEGWLRRHLSTRKDMICSQLVDQSLADAGYHVFDDGRLPQDVVPAEMYTELLSRPGWFLIPGHTEFGRWTSTREAHRIRR